MSKNQQSVRISKYLSSRGHCSRRKADLLLEHNKVYINGSLASVGQRVKDKDVLKIGEQTIKVSIGVSSTSSPKVLALHKPINTLCAHEDKQSRALIYDLLPKTARSISWYSIGRLDFKTTGLLLLTNSGDLAHRLMHPSFETSRVYQVKIKPKVCPSLIEKLYQGVYLDQKIFSQVKKAQIIEQTASASWIEITLTQGRNREVRRLMEKFGYDVIKLKRVRYGAITLRGLEEPGLFRELSASEVERLLKPTTVDS